MTVSGRLHSRKRPASRFAWGFTLLCATSPAWADVLFEDHFSSDSMNFFSNGRAYFYDGYVRLRGGDTTSITSDVIHTNGLRGLSLSYTRNTYRLDSGEGVKAEVSVDGGPFTAVEFARTASGNTTLPIPPVNDFIQLRFSLEASSFFERADLRQIVVEGESGDTCGQADCEEPPTEERTVIIPDSSWECGMPEGIPDPTRGQLLFTTTLAAGTPRNVGETPYGERTVIPVNGGQLTNTANGLNGEILAGAIDFNLALPSGAMEHESRYTIRTGNGTLIYMRNCGVADGETIRFVADFEAPESSGFNGLHQGTYVGIREQTNAGIRLSVYQNPSLDSNDEVIQTPSDNHLRQQTWECPALPANADSGDQVLQARVSIGGFQSIGDSKYGSRRIIPITGGSFSGDLSGNVDAGGADYQLTVNGDLALEARYTLETSDGETIVVRNCGNYANSSLTLPIFEASTSGRYNWLNESEFVGTITPGLGSVTIDVYEQQ